MLSDLQPLPAPGTRACPGAALDHAVGTAARHAAAADRDRRLHPDTAAALTEAGFAAHFVPRRWGGAERTYGELFKATVTMADEGCASAAWCGALWAAHGRFAAYLPQEGQRELWGATPDVRIAAAVMPPSGLADAAPGGWLLSGEWQCVSGVDFADWLLLTAWETTRDGRRSRVLAVPRGMATVVDTWHSTGLRGSGSNTVRLGQTFVPDRRSFLMADLLRGEPGPGRSRCHTVPAQFAGALMFCASALGSALRALREWSGWAARQCGPGGSPGQPSAAVSEALARSSAEVECVRLLLEAAVRRADTDDPTDHAVARNQRDAALGVDLLVTAVERLFRTGGAHVRDDSGELQRCWRDVHTVAAHGMLRLESAAAAYATAVLSSAVLPSPVPVSSVPVSSVAVSPVPASPVPASPVLLSAGRAG
jgi:alkylation response protein AidB-like acyl-CoA dehydrogenase